MLILPSTILLIPALLMTSHDYSWYNILTLVLGDGQNKECAKSHHGESREEDPDEEEEPQPF